MMSTDFSLYQVGIACLLWPNDYYAPFEEGGAYCFAHVRLSIRPSVCPSVGMSVSLNLVQLITLEHFAPEASNLVGR